MGQTLQSFVGKLGGEASQGLSWASRFISILKKVLQVGREGQQF